MIYEQPHNLSSSSFDLNLEEGDASSSNIDRTLQFDELMGSLLHLDRQFSDISMLTKKSNLNENQIQVALSWGLEKIFNIRCPEMLEKRKNIYTSLENFFKVYRQAKIIKPKVQAESGIKSEQDEEESKKAASYLREVPKKESPRRDSPEKEEPEKEEPEREEPEREEPEREEPKVEPRQREYQRQQSKKKESVRSEPLREEIPLPKSNPIELKPFKKGAFSYEEESTQASFSGSNSNPYLCGNTNNQDEYNQKLKTISKKEKDLDDMTYHVEWQKKGNFRMEENTRKVTKLYNDDYRKICGLHPFQDDIVYRIKFRVINMGTIAIGVVKAKDKAGLFIDDRYTDCLKFITFFNRDGGKVNLNGTNLRSGKDLGMSQGQEFEMIFDTKKMHVIMKTSRARNSIDVSLECYRGQVLYPYLEMKQINTEIQFL